MQISYTDKRQKRFCDLKRGQTFIFEDIHYVKTSEGRISDTSKEFNCMNLGTYEFDCFSERTDTDPVIPTTLSGTYAMAD